MWHRDEAGKDWLVLILLSLSPALSLWNFPTHSAEAAMVGIALRTEVLSPTAQKELNLASNHMSELRNNSSPVKPGDDSSAS